MPTPFRTTASWWRTPQRVWLRRVLFQVHFWVGVLLALYCIVIGLSGAALVYKEQITRLTSPQLYQMPHSLAHPIALQQAVQQIEADRPGWRVSGLNGVEQAPRPITAIMGPLHAAPSANYRAVVFDPVTGTVLADHMRFDGLLGWLSNLHFYLLSGKIGLRISGWMAVGLLILSVSGIILWWPGVQRWSSALWLRLHRGRHQSKVNLRRVTWDLHSVVGFWCSVPLLVVTCTGLYFCFPSAIARTTIAITGGGLQQAQQDTPDRKPIAINLPFLSLDAVLHRAKEALPTNAQPSYIAFPAQPGFAYNVTGYYKGSLPFSKIVRVSLDPKTGDVLGYTDTTHQILGLRTIQYFFTVHFGSFGGEGWLGNVVRFLWVLVGIAPALLAVTGLLMFWNRKLRKVL